MSICSCEMAALETVFPWSSNSFNPRFVCMVLQEHECILERWRWHCAYVCFWEKCILVGVLLAGCRCWLESVDATNTMDNAGIMNKRLPHRIKIYLNKNDGVAGGEPALTLAESVHAQQVSPQRCHHLTYLKIFSLVLIAFQCPSCTWRRDWVWQQSGDHTCQQRSPLMNKGLCHRRAVCF